MQAIPSCCENYLTGYSSSGESLPRPAAVNVRSETGLTLGDLIDVAEKLAESHSSCPYARLWMHNLDTGRVDTYIRFERTVMLRFDDPLIPPLPLEHEGLRRKRDKKQDDGKYDMLLRERERKERDIRGFIRAKQAGKYHKGSGFQTLLTFIAVALIADMPFPCWLSFGKPTGLMEQII